MKASRPLHSWAGRAGTMLSAWPSTLVVIAHPDDESFGRGAVIDQLTAAGAALHILCYTHGGACTLNQTRADLHRAREIELRQAAAELGQPASRCSTTPTAASPASRRPSFRRRRGRRRPRRRDRRARLRRHRDNRAPGPPGRHGRRGAGRTPGRAAGPGLDAARGRAGRLSAETGQSFSGQPPGRIDLCVRVSRQRQRRRAALCTPARSRPPPCCGGGFSCSANASTCAGSYRRRSDHVITSAVSSGVRRGRGVRRGKGRAVRAGRGRCRQRRRRRPGRTAPGRSR